MDALRIIAENKIKVAMDNGDFDELSGKGRPVDLGLQLAENDEQFLANHILRNNGFLPDWLGERKLLLEEIQAIQIKQLNPEFTTEQSRETILQLNRRISGYNLRVPIDAMQLQLLSCHK